MEIIRPIADCALPPDADVECDCRVTMNSNAPWQRVYQAPMMMNVAFPDGTKREGFADMKEAARLKVDAANIHHKDRKGINAEIRKLESIKK